MFKTKYYYDKNSLSYRKVEVNKSTQIRNILAFLISSMFFGIMVLLILLKSPLINTPTELTQAREISNFKLQFNLLNKKIDQLNIVLEDIEQRDNNIYRVLFETNPIPSDVRKAGFGGINRYENLKGFENSDLVVETTRKILKGSVSTQKQDDILKGQKPKLAHKIFKESCKIDWSQKSYKVHNHIRGLSPYPTAFSTLRFSDGKEVVFKIFKGEKNDGVLNSGAIKTDGKTELFIGCGDGSFKIYELQLAGKKRMQVKSFLQGVNLDGATII